MRELWFQVLNTCVSETKERVPPPPTFMQGSSGPSSPTASPLARSSKVASPLLRSALEEARPVSILEHNKDALQAAMAAMSAPDGRADGRRHSLTDPLDRALHDITQCPGQAGMRRCVLACPREC